MKEQLISFETAILAKQLGFNEKCSSYYDEEKIIQELNYYSGSAGYTQNIEFEGNQYLCEDIIATACTQSFLQKWIREKYELVIIVEPIDDEECNCYYPFTYCWTIYSKTIDVYDSKTLIENIYEDALELALLQTLEIIKTLN